MISADRRLGALLASQTEAGDHHNINIMVAPTSGHVAVGPVNYMHGDPVFSNACIHTRGGPTMQAPAGRNTETEREPACT